MTYVMSDLHGQYEKYKSMLKIIEFSDKDDLYILGDIVDRGPDSAKLLTDMSMRINVFPIMGNHDVTASFLLKKLCAEITEDNYDKHLDAGLLSALSDWRSDGGQATIDSFAKLSPDERTALIEYMDEFVPYEDITVNSKRFILIHGGIPYEKKHIPLEDQDISELITHRPDYTKRYFKNAFLVTGHTPTCLIGEEYDGRIYRENGHLAIDCGAGFGKALGCLRLDDLKEYYV